MRVIPHEFGGGPPKLVFDDYDDAIEWIEENPEMFAAAMGED